MKRRLASAALFVGLLGAVTAACNGTTGDNLLTFSAYASGVAGAAQPFKAGNFTIQLTSATMHVGAVYFDEAPPGTGFDGPVCIASGIYAAQVPGPVDVDLLSSAPQEFTVYGNGTQDTALSWDIWLTDDDVGGDVLNGPSFTPVVQIQGIATDAAGRSASFGGLVTINAVNRNKGSTDPSQPGADPLCKVRVIQIGGINVPFFPGGTLNMAIDPRVWFQDQSLALDFSPGQLPLVTDPNCNPDSSVPTDPQDYALAPETAPPASQTCGGSSQPCCAAAASGAVLFGGTSSSGTPDDTWAFDGTWSPATVNGSPPARVDAGMAALGGRLVLFGGNSAANAPLDDTWVFDGSSWASVATSAPPARARPSMATLGKDVVLFGGENAAGAPLGDTWTFAISATSGTSVWGGWSSKTIASPPPARSGAGMATLGSDVVLFGGSAGASALLNDTWTYDGKTWTAVTTASAPPARYGASMATLNGDVVLFGGFGSGGAPVGDAWTFDGTNWTQVTTSTAPPARGDASIAPFAGKLVLFGGRGASGALSDTWTFDGTSWKQVTSPAAPSARYGASIAPLSGGQTCLGALTCTNGVCGPTYCIPNSSFLSGADPGATAGVDFFTEIISGAPFSVSYGQQQQ